MAALGRWQVGEKDGGESSPESEKNMGGGGDGFGKFTKKSINAK